MNKAKWIVSMVVVGALGMLGWLLIGQSRENGELQRENIHLKQQVARLADLAIDNQRLSNLVTQADGAKANQQMLELLRLRGEVGMLRRLTNELWLAQEEFMQQRSALLASVGAAADATNITHEPLAVYPKETWEYAGWDTPEHAFQSLNWAALNGELGIIKSNLTAEAQMDFAKAFENKGETEIRAQLADSFNKKTEVRIISKDVINDNLVVLGVSDVKDAASVDKLVFQRINGQWKFVADH